MIKAVLFDLDGVLTDTAVYHYKSWKLIAESFGYVLTEEKNEELKGVSRKDSLDFILKWANTSIDDESKYRLLQRKNELYLELIEDLGEKDILPGIVDFLNTLDDNQCLKGVGSSSKNAPYILERIGLASRFSVVIDGNQVNKTKPDPEVFLLGSEQLNVNPNECLVVEDAPSGALAAKRAGMKVLGIGKQGTIDQADKTVGSLEGITWEDILSI